MTAGVFSEIWLVVFSQKWDLPPPKITCSTLKLPLLVLSQTGFLRNIFSCCTNTEGGVSLQLFIYSLIQVSKVCRDHNHCLAFYPCFLRAGSVKVTMSYLCTHLWSFLFAHKLCIVSTSLDCLRHMPDSFSCLASFFSTSMLPISFANLPSFSWYQQ